MSDLEKEYLQRAAAAADHELTEEDFESMSKGVASGGNWFCYIQCYFKYRACRDSGGSVEECRQKLGACIVACAAGS